MSRRFRKAASAALLAQALFATGAMANPTVLFEVGEGKVLAHEDAFRRWYPASLTKLMTVYVAFRAIKAGELTLQSPIKVSKNSAAEPASKMGYKKGAVMTLDNAFKMLMSISANDIATAIAENVAGSEQKFVERMNAEAARLGMTGSHFANAHGLFDENQYVTARDMAVLANAIRSEFPQYSPYFSIEAIDDGKKVKPNTNPLLGRFFGADGMKTGFVCASGFNMLATATRNGRTLGAVVLGASSQVGRAEIAADLLSKGFAKEASMAPSLSALQPYGDNRDAATNMKETICTAAAAKERRDTRDDNGKFVINSPYVFEMRREPHVVVVGLDAAATAAAEIGVANIPIPTPRPDYQPATASAPITVKGKTQASATATGL